MATVAVGIGASLAKRAVPLVGVGLLLAVPATTFGTWAHQAVLKNRGKLDTDKPLASSATTSTAEMLPGLTGVGLLVGSGMLLHKVAKSAQNARNGVAAAPASISGGLKAGIAETGGKALRMAGGPMRLVGSLGAIAGIAGGLGVLAGTTNLGPVIGNIPREGLNAAMHAAGFPQIPKFDINLQEFGQTLHDMFGLTVVTKVKQHTLTTKVGGSTSPFDLAELPKGVAIVGYKETSAFHGATSVSSFLHAKGTVKEQADRRNKSAHPIKIDLLGGLR
jgi:hypothetical protein